MKRWLAGSCALTVFLVSSVTGADAQSLFAEFAAAGASTPLFSETQIVDRPPTLAQPPSRWGVLGGVTPKFWLPTAWASILNDARSFEGRELRIGIRRGKPLGYEFGFSYVRKTLTQFLFEREGGTHVVPGQEPRGARITYTPLEDVEVPGIEYHTFIPFRRLGPRVQLGSLLSFGVGHVPSTQVRKRIEGPPFFVVDQFPPLDTLPAEGGLVRDDRGAYFPVAPGQTGAETTIVIRDILQDGDALWLIRGHIAADVHVAAPFKLRFSGGFNYPGAQLFNVEAVYMFGAGR